MINKYLLLVLCLAFTCLANAQITLGVTKYNPGETQPGYNLMMPHQQTDAYLLDNCGKVVNHWPGTANPGNSVYLNENGHLVRTGSFGSASNPWIHAGGGGEFVEELDWDNNSIWKFTYNDSLVRMHHDIALLPNGNVLLVAWERITDVQAIAMGRDPALISEGEVWPDKVVEIQPQADSAIVVWEWRAWDHLVQDFDPNLPNFGVIADHPERIDVNYGRTTADWHHVNSIDYNPVLDQIVLSVPAFDELWIIDHSTTTQEAAGTTGGNSGKGGDLLYRWGNPLAYDRGTAADQKLFFQHDVSWIDNEGITSSDPDYGKLLVFNNRVANGISTVNIINPPIDASNNYTIASGSSYGPTVFDYTYADPNNIYSTGLSGAQKQPNGNMLICSGRQGEAREVNASDSIVWRYINPIVQGTILSQGDVINPNTNFVFRFIRYLPTFQGFVGKDLTPGAFLELNPDPVICDMAVGVEELVLQESLSVYPNPTSGSFVVELDSDASHQLEVFNSLGQRVFAQSDQLFPARVDLSGVAVGVYWISVDGQRARAVVVEK